MKGSRLSHKREMGKEVSNSMRIVLLSVRVAKERFCEPKAWVHRGSMPMARPERTE